MKSETGNLARFAESQTAERLKTFASMLRKARKHPGHADRIHDLRVSIRRFAQALRVFKDLWDHRHYRKMRRRLRKLMDLCGAVRNYDIAIEILEAAGTPAAGSLKRSLLRRRARAESDLSERMEGWKSQRIMRPWSDWLKAQAGKRQSIPSRARQILRPLAEEYFKVGTQAAQPETNPEELHQLRLIAKRFRYSLEIFGDEQSAGVGHNPSATVPAPEIERIREVQDLLGAINDCVTTGGLLAEYGHTVPLNHLLDQRLDAFREYWRTVYGSRKRRRSD